MYDLLVHHQNELKAAHSRAERWEDESRRLSAEKTRSEHGKAAEIQVFQARASADQSRLVARLKTVEAQNTELRQQLERAERKAAQLERARDALAAKAALQDTRDTVERAAEGLSAPYTSAAAVPPWDTMVPSAYVADFTSLYGAEPQRSSADANYWSYDPYAGYVSYAYRADQAWTCYGQWPSADPYGPGYNKPANAGNTRSLNPVIPRQRRRVIVEPFLPLWIPQQTATTTGSWTPTAVSMQAGFPQPTTTTAGAWSMPAPQPDERSGFRRLLRPVTKLFRRGKGRHARRER
ncbi:hypothetical protein [Streptomyces pseudovenezuelae]|uniref:hypothetical protein n=1 Tax=Streptomyces pseudovenezuelae TaxID=67350 RepID=UPI003719CD8F